MREPSSTTLRTAAPTLALLLLAFALLMPSRCVQPANAVPLAGSFVPPSAGAWFFRAALVLNGLLVFGIEFDTFKPVGVFSRAAELTRARRASGWEPQTSFGEGLSRTIRWYYASHDVREVAEKLGLLLTER